MFSIGTDIHLPILATGREAHGPTSAMETYCYYIFGYIGNCQYCFEFVVNRTCDNIICAGIKLGCLIIQINLYTLEELFPRKVSIMESPNL